MSIREKSKLLQNKWRFSKQDSVRLKNAEQMSEYMVQTDLQQAQLDFLQQIVSQTKVTYLDANKIYAVVQTKYLEQLEAMAAIAKTNVNKLKTLKHQEDVRSAGLKKIIDSKSAEYQVFMYQQKQMKNQHERMSDKIKQVISINQTKQQQIQRLLTQVIYPLQERCEELEKSLISHEKGQINFGIFEKSVQTEYDADEIRVSDEVIEKIVEIELSNRSKGSKQETASISNTEKQLQKLRGNFAAIVDELTVQMATKLQELKTQRFGIEKWEQENRVLQQQNRQLQAQIVAIDEKHKMLEIWKSQANSFLKKIQDHSESKQSHIGLQEIGSDSPNEVSSFTNKLQIKKLEDRVLELEAEKMQKTMRAEELEKLLSVNVADIAQQGIVTNLVKFSQQVKQAIKFLVTEI